MKKVNRVMSVEEAKRLIRDKDPAGVPALCEAFKNDVTTTKLDLTRLRIGDEGAAALAEALKVNCTLKELRLDGNRIGDEGEAALAEALRVNCTLTALSPSYVAPDAIKRNTELAPLALASQRTGMLVLRKTPIDWRIVKHIIAPYLMNNAGGRDLVPL